MKHYLIMLPLALLMSCGDSNKENKEEKAEKAETKKENANSKIRNGIKIEEHGLNVEQAFLVYEDNTLVPEGNETEVNKKIECRLVVNGWKEKDGKVYPGASERIETSSGELLLDEKDLFKDYEAAGVDPKDANFVTISAVITSVSKLYDYYVVKFRVWDRVSEGYAEGSFNFKLK